MKKTMTAALAAAMLLSLSACSEGTEPASTGENGTTAPIGTADEKESGEVSVDFTFSPFTASDVTAAVLTAVPINSAVEKGIDDLSVYFTSLDPEGVTEASYYICGSGAYPDEIAVLKFSSDDLAKTGLEAVKERLDSQYATYESYTPKEMYKFDGAVAEARGSYVVYLITADNDTAKEVVGQYIS
ncbi:MAG: DUF4358 domain-containing protein [Ruminiclostridium sp.]|nr:DUF4358 domain-containing protein [Ruminiclostridium sp.]